MRKHPIIDIFPRGESWQAFDPFLACLYHDDLYPTANANLGPSTGLRGRDIGQDFELKDGWRMYHGSKVPGFPKHPHRGFETVTVVRQGFVDHSDSLGAKARYGKGDVQWMTAGKGIQHSEIFPLLNTEEKNPLELFQIWLNLPSQDKMADPEFDILWEEDIPIISAIDENDLETKITVIAGTLEKSSPPPAPSHSWANDPKNSVAIWHIQMPPNAQWILPESEAELSRTLYFFKGETLSIQGKTIPVDHGVSLDSLHRVELKNGPKSTEILLLQGKPIREKVVQYGPFVMGSKAEIQTAFMDFQTHQFGGWPWESDEPVHGKNPTRFVKLPAD